MHFLARAGGAVIRFQSAATATSAGSPRDESAGQAAVCLLPPSKRAGPSRPTCPREAGAHATRPRAPLDAARRQTALLPVFRQRIKKRVGRGIGALSNAAGDAAAIEENRTRKSRRRSRVRRCRLMAPVTFGANTPRTRSASASRSTRHRARRLRGQPRRAPSLWHRVSANRPASPSASATSLP